MKLGLQIPDFTWPNGPAKLGAELAEVAQAADEAGFEYLAVMDHFFQIQSIGPAEHDMLEAYTTLGYLAAHTKRAKLLTVITGVIYRQPGVLAKAVTTLDVLSGGRAILGIGAGWNEEESRGLGFPFPPTKERFEMLEEALRYIHQMFSDNDGPFEGDYITAERLMNVPAPLSKPHPPIMVGGSGEKKTLRFVAKYGDACNIFNGPELEHKLEVLRGHCEAEGRDYDEISKTVYHPLDIGANGEKTEELMTELRRLAGLGVDAAIGYCPTVPDTKPFEIFAKDVIPAAAEL
ncbi:F420-dependent oxidoreductase-like protein [Amycolatopsis bartoniae]|uniref:LLM class F420-dependent oxidoreductase n=1 Tax=Amycolatopsis bartoniae TaxID=941986 RepID=A0A8H9MEE8_9PSEU|nr:LLM class F420-dependent oxidoreductase [Amycolatopsis bartoniae]MBB2933735.1 F420-dependent oxidoreductase-like protein [Amycolatopsis bartoniae]TVT10597.1 LLM class F420-dependent oxidoreductase [Amycolatopsis bartoniae]GHF72000.1 LLM class F420-dependent oxidoreductase [Amycolatopsis bartoniae]